MTETLSGSKRLDWLKRQMDQALADVETITSRAADEDRELSDSEHSTCEARRSRIDQLEPQIQVEADLAKRSATYQGMVANIGSAPVTEQRVERQTSPQPEAEQYQTPGRYFADFFLRSEDADAKRRFDTYRQRALANQTTAQNPGLLPVPILGPVFVQATQRRPAVEATTRRPLPGAGKTFQRPKINQHTIAGIQATEKTEVPSQAMLIDPVTVTKSTFAGAVNLSWQDRDWTDPAILDILTQDLMAAYADETDKAFCTYFKAAATVAGAVDDSTVGSAWLNALFSAASSVQAAVNAFPDTIWCSPDVWAMLGTMVDNSGRQMFPTVNPVNAMGSVNPNSFVGSIAGMRLVVDKNFAAGTAIVGDSTFVETYETVGGQVTATEPSILGTQIAFYGYMAWLVLEVGAFVDLAITTPVPGGTTTTTEPTNGGTYTGSAAAASKKAGT